MNELGSELIAMEMANPQSAPLATAYTRLWETPRPERRRLRLAWLAARLIRLAYRLAPAPETDGARAEPTRRRIPAANATGQP